MSTFDNIDYLMKKQNLKQVELCEYLGVSKNRYTDWKSGRINSYVKYLPQIAEFLGVTVEFLTSDIDVYDEIEEYTNFVEGILKQKNGQLKLKIIFMNLGMMEYDADANVAMAQNSFEYHQAIMTGMDKEEAQKKYISIDLDPDDTTEEWEEYRAQKKLNEEHPEIRLQRIEELKKELRAKKD